MKRTKFKDSVAIGVALMLVFSMSIAFLPTSAKLAFKYETTVKALLLARLLIGLILISMFLLTTGAKFILPLALAFRSLFLRCLLLE